MNLEELEAITKAAHQGPWHYETCYGVATIVAADRENIAHAVEYLKPDNAKFISIARTAMPLLIKIAQAASSLLSEDDALEAVSHFNAAFILRDALAALREAK